MFRSTRDGGVTVRLSGGEATLLRTLVVPVMELLNDPERPSPPSDPAAPDESADVFAELERQFSSPDEPDPELPADTVVGTSTRLASAYRGRTSLTKPSMRMRGSGAGSGESAKARQ